MSAVVEAKNVYRDARPHALPDDLISVPQAAKRLGVHPESLYRLIRSGDFPPAIHIGRLIRVSVPKLQRHLHGDA